MSSDDSSVRKSSKKRISFNSNVKTYGNRSKKADHVALVVEGPSPPKRPRISSPDARSRPSGSKKGETRPDEKSTGRDSSLNSPSELDSESNVSSEDEPKGKKKAKKNKRSKSKSGSQQRELGPKEHEQSTPESFDDQDLSITDLSPRTKAEVLKAIKKGKEKKSKSQAGPSVKPEKPNTKVKPEIKHDRGGGSTRVVHKKDAHLIIADYIWLVLFQLTGWKDMYDHQEFCKPLA